jgi:hypothetical protein
MLIAESKKKISEDDIMNNIVGILLPFVLPP